MARSLIQLGVKSDDTTIGICQLLIDPRQLFLAFARIGQRLEQFLILSSDLIEGVFRPLHRERADDFVKPRGRHQRRAMRVAFF